MGIWPPYATGTDVNALDRSHNGKWAVTSDDKGKVKVRMPWQTSGNSELSQTLETRLLYG